MSGGHFDYIQHRISNIADQIEEEFITNDGKYEDTDWVTNKPITIDRFSETNEEQRKIITNEIVTLVTDLRNVCKRTKALDYFICGDHGVESYIKKIEEIKNI